MSKEITEAMVWKIKYFQLLEEVDMALRMGNWFAESSKIDDHMQFYEDNEKEWEEQKARLGV